MFNLIKNLFYKEKVQNLGIIEPTEKELAKMPHFEEIVAKANAVDWKLLDPSKNSYKVRNQAGSSSCVAFTRASIWALMYFLLTGLWIDFSALWPYGNRKNKPDEGMYAQDGLELGMLPDDLAPSDNLSEAQMNTFIFSPWLKEIAKKFEMGKPIVLPTKDIEMIASVIQTTGKPVQIFLRFGPGEWFGQFIPKIIANNLAYGHSVMAYDYGIYDGRKSIVILDSAHSNTDRADGKRIITDTFYNSRNCFAQYWMKFKFEIGIGDKPSYNGTIISFQKCARYEGLFPINVDFVENLGPVTREAVVKFQGNHGIETTGNLGPKTKSKLLELYP